MALDCVCEGHAGRGARRAAAARGRDVAPRVAAASASTAAW